MRRKRIPATLLVEAERVALSARALVTVPPDHPVWESTTRWEGEIRGAIVRMQPPASADDARVREVERFLLEEAGAAVVRPDSRAQAEIRPMPSVISARATQREIVMGLAGDDAELRELLDEELTKAGL